MGKMSSRKRIGIGWIIFGMLVGIAVCTVLLMGTTMLLLSGRIGESCVEMLVSGIVFFSVFCANIYAGKIYDKPLHAASTQVSVLIALMLIGGCLLDGQFDGVWLRTGTALAGGLSAYVICLKKGKKHFKGNRRYS